MKKVYPYLDNPWGINYNTQKESRNFLKEIDSFVNQKQYVRITLLNWNEDGLKEIEGELTSGTITKDSSSTVRRTCSFNCSVNGTEYNIEDANMDFAINKKIYIEIGIKNYTKQYPEFPILWFPQGVFFISSFSAQTSATSTVNLSLQLKDKMAALNGEIGGTFPATTVLDEVDTQSPSGAFTSEKVLIYDIIVEILTHFGGEIQSNIVIEDVPTRIQRIMKWTGGNPLWMRQQGTIDEGLWYEVSIDEPASTAGWKQYVTGQDVGYIYSDFVYDQELVAAPGESVTSILDKIKEYLGNYEYFYDEFGIFHFREIKNYMNTTQATVIENAASEYLTTVNTPKSTFSFSDDTNLISMNINPKYENIKNDYIIEGKHKSTLSNLEHVVRYHLAIDHKPQTGNVYKDLLLYRQPNSTYIEMQFPMHVGQLPEVGNFNVIYCVAEGEYKFYYWEDDKYKPIEGENFVKYISNGDPQGYVVKDWRTELYIRGLLARNNGTDASQYYANLENHREQAGAEFPWLEQNFSIAKHEKIDVDFYFEEISAFWPQIYDLENQCFWGQEEDETVQHRELAEGVWYLDFIDPSTPQLGQFCVSNIGRRTIVSSKDEINCVFEPEIPEINFINIDADDADDMRDECIELGTPYTQVRGEIYYALTTGGYNRSCFDELKYQLYLHTNYQKTVSLVALPAFYLEPNTRVRLDDNSLNVHGDFMITNITIPLGAGNTMSVSGSEVSMDRYF